MKETQINDMKKILETPLEEIYRHYINDMSL
jgi:endonuclease IV